jgi:hypothetical protein
MWRLRDDSRSYAPASHRTENLVLRDEMGRHGVKSRSVIDGDVKDPRRDGFDPDAMYLGRVLGL